MITAKPTSTKAMGTTTFGLVAPGYSMAKVAASHIVSGGTSDTSFTGADTSTKLKTAWCW
ncbi:hypothetical protein O9929_23525 [Vibrio lentus]|nr:hypothetical protein [Vibrio lentus]